MKGLPHLNLRRLTTAGRGMGPLQPGMSLLGLAFDGRRLDAAWVRRTNGSVVLRKSFSTTLSEDPLTAPPAAIGRELRKQLDAAGIRERRCALCLPLRLVLTLTTKLPDLPEADLQSYLQIEAERGFPYDLESLVIARSPMRPAGGEACATLVAVPREPLNQLVAVLEAASLRPVSISPGITALLPAEDPSADGVLALHPGETSLDLQVSCGGGVALLRTIEGAFEREGEERRFQVDHAGRELRITLGQLPSAMRDSVRDSIQRLQLFGTAEEVESVSTQLAPRTDALGIRLESVTQYAPSAFPVKTPPGTAVSPAFSLATRLLAGQKPVLEFLPPRVSSWQQFTSRYSSQRMVHVGIGVGAIALFVALAFLVQQIRIWTWESKWRAIKPRVTEVAAMQADNRRYRPWFDDSFRSLSILRRLTESFPEDGSVSAKTVEIRQPAAVTCTGTAKDNAAWLKTLDKLMVAKGVANLQVPETKGTRPVQFTFNFQWNAGGTP